MTTLLSIPLPCTLEHLIGEEAIPLGKAGHLSLVSPPPSPAPTSTATAKESDDTTTELEAEASKDDVSEIVVILKVGDLAFPLSKTIPFGTTSSPFSYMFKPTILPGQPSGWVKLSLPSNASQAFPSETSSANTPSTDSPEITQQLLLLRDSFEKVLIELGLLTDSIVIASADDVGQSIRGQLGGLALSVDQKVQQRNESTPAVEEGQEFQAGDKTKRFFEGLESTSQGIRGVSGSLTQGLQQGVMWVGNEIGKRLPAGEKKEIEETVDDTENEKKEMSAWQMTKEATSAVAGGVVDGTSQLASHSNQGVQDALAHSQGPEAASLASHVSNTAANVGGTAADVVVNTSTVLLGGMGAKAVAEADRSGADVEATKEPNSDKAGTKP